MPKEHKYKALLLPADAPPAEVKLKRHLLFFDHIAIIDPQDRALINDGEVTETFSGMTVTWAARANFPRIENYQDQMESLLQKTKPLQSRRLLSVLPVRTPVIDQGIAWTLYGSAISDASLLAASVPDASISKPSIQIPNGVVYGMGISVTGHKSKYDVSFSPVAHLPATIDPAWSSLGQLRIARAIKGLRRSFAESALPVALDDANQGILEHLLIADSANVGQMKAADALAQFSISLDVVDPVQLESALQDMSWPEVLKVRKEILPKIAELRKSLFESLTHLKIRSDLTFVEYQDALYALKKDFENKKQNLADEWEKLKIAATLKFCGTLGAGGLTLLKPASSWIEQALHLGSVGLIGAATLSPELKSLIPAVKKVRTHPLFFTDKLKNINN